MKAVVHDRYGPPEVQRIAEVPRPAPHAGQVLIRVRATTVNRTDTGLRAAQPFISRFVAGVLRPRWRILGTELAGEVVEIGDAVSEFKVGDAVFGVNAWNIGGGSRDEAFGAHAEYVCMNARGALTLKPANMSFEEAAAVCDGAVLALMCLRPMHTGPGQQLLIYGASGSIGTAGVQLAKHFGAIVTAVCSSKDLDVVRSLGADQVIDYTKQDFTRSGQTYDAVFDAVGMLSFRRCRGSLRKGGCFATTDHLRNVALARWSAWFGDKRVLFPIPPRYTKEDVVFLKGLIEAGSYRAVIDRTYPLEQVVEATRYVETKQKTGNVVLRVS